MGPLAQGVEILVPRRHFFEVVADFGRYPEFLPEVRGIQVRELGPGLREVTYRLEVDVGIATKALCYTLEHREEPPDRLSWRLIGGDLFKQNRGCWLLEELGEARTRATYSIDVAFGLLVPRAVSNLLTGRSLPRMLQEFKAAAEQRWAARR